MVNKKGGTEKKSFLDLDISTGRVNLTQKAVFAKNLALMLKSGLVISEAMEILEEQTTGGFKKVIAGVLKSIQAGHSLAASFSRYPKVFYGMFIDITRAGEEAGTLEQNLNDIADHLEKERELTAKIKGAMLYPVVVLVAALFLGLGIAYFVLPKIVPLFEGLKVDLPLTTRMLIWISHLIIDYGIYLFGAIIGFLAFMWWLIKRRFSRPVTHWLLLKTPMIKKIVKDTNIARFCRVFATLLKSGINIDEALNITKSTLGNYYYQKSMTFAFNQIVKGNTISSELTKHPDLYPIVVTRMINVGEKSGNLEGNLFYLAEYYEKEVDNTTKSIATIIEPVLLIFIGITVAFLALSIITPIYQITGNVKR